MGHTDAAGKEVVKSYSYLKVQKKTNKQNVRIACPAVSSAEAAYMPIIIHIYPLAQAMQQSQDIL